MDLTPVFRIEQFLDAIINSTTPPNPVFREEYFLAKIAGADVETPDPVFRLEKYLAKIGGDDVEIPTPILRPEFWLAKKCGEDVETPTPVFRLEYFLEEWVNGSAPAYKSVTGKIVEFFTRRVAPIEIEADLSPIQDLHGYDAPWPPGGGKNKLKNEIANGTNRGVTFTLNDNGTISISGTNDGTSYSTRTITNTFPTESGVEYVLSGGLNANIFLRDNTAGVVDTGTGATFTGDGTDHKIEARVVKDYAITGTVVVSPMICLSTASNPTAFAPFANECPISGHTGADVYVEDEYDAQATPTATITFGTTVCGGKLTVNEDGSGDLTVTWGNDDFGDLSWTYDQVRSLFYAVLSDKENATDNNGYCSAFKLISNATSINDANNRLQNGQATLSKGTSNPYIYVRDTDYSSANTFKTAMTGQKICYQLATPITIPLNPGQVEALKGNNTVWVDDSGEIKVTYRSN